MGKKAKSLNLDKAGYKKFMLPVYGAFNKANPKESVQGINYKAPHGFYMLINILLVILLQNQFLMNWRIGKGIKKG
jgi:hypothetical protein